MDITDRCSVNSLREVPGCNPVDGTVRWDATHSLWNGGMLLGAVCLAPIFFSWSAVAIFLFLTGASLLLGHSVGFHRRLIHRSFDCPKWLERTLVWIGTSVGMSGPLWMIRTHDMRDWAQRQPDCHDYLAHRRSMPRDAFWQLHCRLDLKHPPTFEYGEAGKDSFYRFLEATWMAQQIPVAALLFIGGGWSWVVWGICARVSISVTGHWFVGHLAHRTGPQSWLVNGAGVQAHDVPWAAMPTMGEAWHNNHHAFPGSARIGLHPGQSDWGYASIQLLQKLGLAWDIVLPHHLDRAEAVTQIANAPQFLPASPITLKEI
ncbi:MULTISPECIES: acyl-CoA desaturase [unclassified Sphingobium]|uniref:acyl-CoA desaturase n=1 Tax=unclassified Sphingobium TaxID=2611147 RepID=UPI000D179AA3|nr:MULTISPECIES: acyl-CoA desaturase [unclassified Sphingobium]MBG6118214.1 stearoyl-CoA desaturase (delta-9 desaturase) [Sphingobium sp. JAI105]PSO10198.1 acyl-CoA desaturase [Sphingobium sp. AEW4]TWC95659.1 stearoyl-CoA desaturase (delta-9 desaturase) [Sphingobium sp. AEW010]TWD15086.1 stearoyl-CoA desaturase (delta-9 desaturase) [Sphingobium sp. AEW013]TWD18931.1 stearoyl-CoA desaturase (delta-9 desaturase) [Sphingobium sp. AEW001]